MSRDERDASRLKQVTTGRGQANAKPVRANPMRTKTVGPGGRKEVYVETWDDSLADRGFDFITFDPAGS